MMPESVWLFVPESDEIATVGDVSRVGTSAEAASGVDLQGAGTDRGGAGIGVVARENKRAASGLGQVADLSTEAKSVPWVTVLVRLKASVALLMIALLVERGAWSCRRRPIWRVPALIVVVPV
jgi:hypothetical protein